LITRLLGVPEVEELARQTHLEVEKRHRQQIQQAPYSGILSQEEMIELLTRTVVRQRFVKETSGLKSIYKVVFETAYPTPPSSWRYSV
jgi:hypothetical protein